MLCMRMERFYGSELTTSVQWQVDHETYGAPMLCQHNFQTFHERLIGVTVNYAHLNAQVFAPSLLCFVRFFYNVCCTSPGLYW